ASLLEVTEAPTVENFLRPFELSGAELEVEASIFYTYCSSIGGAEWDRVEAELSPKMTAHEDALYMDPRLYRRFEQLCQADLDPETAYTAREHLKRCQQSGAGLDEAARGELAAINNRMAELSTEIGQRIVQAGLDDAVEFTEAELSGLDNL
ncbi:M3 family peptidase, partial [Actinotignum timonense]|nr:M3 family peptidase [Actinotignum timonense]